MKAYMKERSYAKRLEKKMARGKKRKGDSDSDSHSDEFGSDVMYEDE